MKLFASVIAIAVGLGYLFGGRLRRFERLRLRWWWLALLGFAIQFIPLPQGEAGTDLLVRTAALSLSYTLLVLFLAANVRLPGAPLVLIGILGNSMVIAANGGMPVSEQALAGSGQPEVLEALLDSGAQKHHLMDDGDVLTFLADTVAVPQPIGQVISVGDVFVYAGLIVLAVATMRGRIPSRSPTSWGPYRGKHRPGSAEESPAPVTLDPLEPLPAATGSGTGP